MTSNKYIGTVAIQLGEKTYTLQYTWKAIAAITTKFGKEFLNNLLYAAPDELAFALEQGLAHENVKASDIEAVSPPITAMALKVNEALGYAYFGPDGPPKENRADNKKKTA